MLYVVAFLAGTLSYSTREIQYPAVGIVIDKNLLSTIKEILIDKLSVHITKEFLVMNQLLVRPASYNQLLISESL